MSLSLVLFITTVFTTNIISSFVIQSSLSSSNNNQRKGIVSKTSSLFLSSSSSSETTKEKQDIALPSTQWELDCYSRPVIVDGNKKLWEALITDSTGSMKICETLPSNRVNSRELRRVIEEAIENAEVKPTHIRFFRGSMFNMMNIALQELSSDGITIIPSRCTYALFNWLQDRHKNVYPAMEGYKPTMMGGNIGGSIGGDFIDIRTPVKLPDALRGEKYAFVSLPLAEFLPETGSISNDNIGVGKLFPINPKNEDLSGDAFIQGIVVFSSRAKALAQWLNGVELYGLKVDIRKRILIVEADITTQYLMARLDDEQRDEGKAFEQGKKENNGLHFICVQEGEDDDMPKGFWLLRENDSGI